MSPSESTEVRLDKWLWAVRLYKTRSLAIEACKAGHVKVAGERVKPARPIRVGEVVAAQIGPIERTVKVLAPLGHRIGAKLVPQYAEDLTPAAEYEKLREPKLRPLFTYDQRKGRPTKRDRRLLDGLSLEGT